jgi:alpha-tubulin suppressor-like RCC1 family protein
MENKNFYIKSISQLGIPNNINLNSSIIYSSPYKNLILFLVNNNLFYKGEYIDQQNSNNFIFEKINSNNTNKPNVINLQQKFIQCDFTSDYIYFITQNKNEIQFSNYLSYNKNNTEIISVLPGILQKKKIKTISCGLNTTLFLTYGGMVYSNSDTSKENQKLITDLLEYNIDQTYSGSQHFFCIGQKRNKPEDGSLIFSWGNNDFSQCGVDANYKYISNPKIIFKNVFIKQIALGKNHSMILTNIGEVVVFGDNQFNQCSPENKDTIRLTENDNILPITEINYYTTSIDYLDKNNEKIEKIEAKNDSSIMITDKKSIIFRGKILGKEKIFKSNNKNENSNLLYSFGGDNYFLLLNNNKSDNNNIYTEVKNNNSINNNYKKLKLFGNSDNKSQKKLIKDEEDMISDNNAKTLQRSITPINNNKFNTISFQNDLTFEELKKEQNKSLTTNADISEDSLTELRSYISLLGISFSSTYNDSNLSFRPKNLPPKSKEEENLHRQLVLQNRQMYINLLKQKQELEKLNMQNLEQKYKQQKIKAEFWSNKIIPNWSNLKNNKNIKKYFYDGIPNIIRGKIWALCIGNKFSITKEYYDIEAKKSIQLLMKLERNNLKKRSISNSIVEESDFSSSMSLSTKKIYSKYIRQTLDKDKSINLIDLDIERTFPYMGVFKKESQLGENLREILRIFVVARPDIGYVQGLSYIAATLLLEMDKFQAFVCFMNIILSPNILPFYRLDEQNIKKRLDLFNEIFKINLPDLYEHFKENEVLPEHYLLEWLMTLYTRSLYIDLSLRIWDIYMIEGIAALYMSAIVILNIHKKEYMQMEFSDIMNHLKNLENNKYDEDKFIDRMNKVKFNDKIINEIHKFNEEYLLYE